MAGITRDLAKKSGRGLRMISDGTTLLVHMVLKKISLTALTVQMAQNFKFYI